MSDAVEIVGAFAEEHGCVQGIGALRAASITDFRVFAPIPSPHILEAIGRRKSRVRLFVLIGGITGVLTGLAITIGTSMEWNLVAGGKPIISWPPFIIICFELMILFGGISAVLSFLGNARVPAFESARGYSSRFGDDRFGIAVRCGEPDAARVESLLKQAGAEEVAREAA
jgi:Alternative complex III, ActD subunit